MQDEGVEALAEAMEFNKTVKAMSLVNNTMISQGSLRKLLKAMNPSKDFFVTTSYSAFCTRLQKFQLPSVD